MLNLGLVHTLSYIILPCVICNRMTSLSASMSMSAADTINVWYLKMLATNISMSMQSVPLLQSAVLQQSRLYVVANCNHV